MAEIPPLRETLPEDSPSAKDEEAAFRHKERVQQAELGYVGKILGSEREKPGNIAGMVLCAVLILVSVILFRWDKNEHFLEVFASLVSIVTLILGYLFGSRK